MAQQPSNAIRQSLAPIKMQPRSVWKPKLPKGVIDQDSYESNKARKMSFKPKER